jgi:hypothetical protein
MATYWNALRLINQVAGELGLPQYATVVGVSNVQSIQLLSLLNSSGNELNLYYTWEQFTKEWDFTTTPGLDSYDTPVDLKYFTDQTQWDRTNHWPLLGPKSAQEWAWLKGSFVASLPRMRYRIYNNQLKLYPPPPGPLNLAMEYVKNTWVLTNPGGGGEVETDMIALDSDILQYDPWLLIKFLKLKFYELKGFDTTGVQADFMRIFNSLTGKDVGAKILSLTPRPIQQYLGPWSVPDGSWNVGS